MTASITRDQLRFAINDLDEQAPRLLPEKGTSIVMYSTDASCGRDEALAERLEQLSYADVRVYRAGSRTGRARDFPWRQGQPDERPSLPTVRTIDCGATWISERTEAMRWPGFFGR